MLLLRALLRLGMPPRLLFKQLLARLLPLRRPLLRSAR